MQIVAVTLFQHIDYVETTQYHVDFNANTITPQLMDKLLKILYDKNIVKWNKEVHEGWKYTYEYTSELDASNERSFTITLHNQTGPVSNEEWIVQFDVIELEEVD